MPVLPEARQARVRGYAVEAMRSMSQSYLRENKMTEAEEAIAIGEMVNASGSLDRSIALLIKRHGEEEVRQAARRAAYQMKKGVV